MKVLLWWVANTGGPALVCRGVGCSASWSPDPLGCGGGFVSADEPLPAAVAFPDWTARQAEQDQCDTGEDVVPCGGRRTSTCLLYTSDAADDLLCVDLGGR